MKKQLFFFCLMVSIANMHAMEDAKMQSAHNSDDDALENNTNRFNEKRDKLLDELDTITHDLAGLHIKAITLEETIRGKDGFKHFKLLKRLDFKRDRQLKRIKGEQIDQELAHVYLKAGQKKSYIRIAKRIGKLEHEEIVLSQAIQGMEELMERISGTKSTKPQPLIAQPAKKDVAEIELHVPENQGQQSSSAPQSIADLQDGV